MNPFLKEARRPAGGDWRDDAECGRLDNMGDLIHDADLWHPEGDTKTRAAMRTKAAKICAACPLNVADACFAEGLANDEPWGIYGGVDLGEMRRREKDPASPGYTTNWKVQARRARRTFRDGPGVDRSAYFAERYKRQKLEKLLAAQRAELDAAVSDG